VTRKRRARPFYTLDCETDPFKVDRLPQPFLWGLYDGQNNSYWQFETKNELLEFLADKDWLIYAHNGGKFDYHYLRDEINSDQNIMVIAGRLAKFHIGACEFRDSINVLVNPLRVFAKEKIDYAKLEPDIRHLHREEIERYLRSDCVNLWETLHAYFERFGTTLTQAGASMRAWQKSLTVTFRKQTAAQSQMYRPFYYGGRVQCFRSGHARTGFKVIDINSAYPFAMLQKHPFSPEGLIQDELPRDDKLGPCMIKLDAIAKGCFPLRDEKGSLYFPEDERTVREYCITGWELIAAMEANAVQIVRLKEIHEFPLVIDFKDYIEHHYAERMKARAAGDQLGDTFHKLWSNSLYGKFSSNPERYHEYLIAHSDGMEKHIGRGYEDLQPWGTRRLMGRKLPEEKHRYYNVATAASITGYVRAMLFRASRQVSGLIYGDTDSLACEDTGNLPLGDKLGEWKVEMICDAYAVAGKKTYAFRDVKEWTSEQVAAARDKGKHIYLDDSGRCWKVASKGADLKPWQIIEAAEGRAVVYSPQVPTYSIHRAGPVFIPRNIRNTAKDISRLEGVTHA
jgi:hypothetical protein